MMGSGEVVGDGRLRRPDTLSGETCAAPASSRPGTGVRALIVALKPGNAGGAKGGRKVEMDQAGQQNEAPGPVPVWLYVSGDAEALARSYAELLVRAMQMLMAFMMEVAEDTVELLFSTPATTSTLAPLSCAGPSVQSDPPTGEPDAGDPPVRFGGRGRHQPLPTPIGKTMTLS
jgi:hypothetical protein